MDEQSDIFSQLFVPCLECDNSTTDVNLEIVIDKLLKLDYGKRIFAVTTKNAGEVLCHFATHTSLISNRNESLLNKYFQLAVHLTSSQEITLESIAVNTLLSKISSIWTICINNTASLQHLLDAVAAITYQNGPYISAENIAILLDNSENSLYAIAKSQSVNKAIKRTAVQCFAGLCLARENGDQLPNEYLQICMKLFVSLLQDLTVNPPHDIAMCRIVFAVTKGLHNILSTNSSIHMLSIGPLLAVLKKFMVYGLPGLSGSAPDELQPDPIPELHSAKPGDGNAEVVRATPSKSQAKKKKRKPKPKPKPNESSSDAVCRVDQMGASSAQFRPTWVRVTSSESEYSDTEGAQLARLRTFLSRIRQMCLSVLYQTVTKTDKHTMLGYWSSFLSESSGASSLFTSFKEDMSPKCRAAALGVVGAMLEGSRWYLAFAAEETASPSHQPTPSFVPFSVSLAALIREIHKQLLSASRMEQSQMALSQLLKTLSVLVNNTPYRKMKPGLLIKVSLQARYFLTTSRDTSVKVACLALLGAVASTNAPLGEVANILTDSTFSTTLHPPTSGDHTPVKHKSLPELASSGSWLIDQCIAFTTRRQETVPSSTQFYDRDQLEIPHSLKVESLVTLTKIMKGYLSVVRQYIGGIGDVVCECLGDHVSTVRINAGKLLEELGSSLVQIMKLSPSKFLEDESLSLWLKVLGGPLQASMQDRNTPALQGKGCDSLSTINPTVFTKLPRNLQMMCLTLLLGYTSDENAVVRAPAVRALGVYVMFPCMREDVAFLEDVASTVLQLLDDPLLVVRANAAWSLGNLTDTLVINQELRPHFKEEFRPSLLLELFNRAMKAMDDKVKVLFNMMRVLGNLLRFADGSHVKDDKFKPVMLKATRVLSEMVAGDVMVKVRWNACTACGNLLRNKSLPLGEMEWTDHVYQALCDSVATCKNFKVRIKAALALATVMEREHYGTKFSEVFVCLVDGFECSDVTADFTEYKFRDALQEQLCTTLIHLAAMVKPEDVTAICAGLTGKGVEINQRLATYHNKLAHAVEVESTLSSAGGHSSANGTCSIVTNDVTQSAAKNDPIEEYIVTKQLTSREKLDELAKATNHINSLALQRVNGNPVHDGATSAKGQSDQSLLCEVFVFLDVV